MTVTYRFIDNEEDLLDSCQQFSSAAWLAVDTEFERVSTYFPELCLIQISNGIDTVVIDPLTITNLGPLLDLLYKESITKVFHSARQDLELFFHMKGKVPTPLFDTQLAAALLGYAKGIGYGNLIREVLNIELEKGHARTDWKRRPLTDEQLKYAADDVIYLAKVYEIFMVRLKEINNLNALDEQHASLCRVETYLPDPDKIWKKIFAARRLNGEKQEIIRKLVAWRENTAREKNRPRKWIVPDHVLVEVAKRLPNSKEELLRIDKVGEKTVNRYGDELLEIINTTK